MPSIYHPGDLSNHSFLVTGGAGFIGSNIVSYLIKNGARKIRVLDNLSTGLLKNISEYSSTIEFIEGDIRDANICKKSCDGIEFVLHQAALGSVPRSVKDPLTTHEVNATGFLNMLVAAKDAQVKRFIYASSSAVYGDHPALPKIEENTGNPISPYAVTKKTNELYARVFYETYGIETIGLRYFNVFGPNQSPDAQYAAVIPLFIKGLIDGKSPVIYGDGNQTRDFTYVDNVVQANIRAVFAETKEALNKNYNIATAERISVNNLFENLAQLTSSEIKPEYKPQRAGDIRDSLADISLAKKLLGYSPEIKLKDGLKITLEWFSSVFSKTN